MREIYTENNELIQTESISEDFYPPVHQVEVHGLIVKQSDTTTNNDSTNATDTQTTDTTDSTTAGTTDTTNADENTSSSRGWQQ